MVFVASLRFRPLKTAQTALKTLFWALVACGSPFGGRASCFLDKVWWFARPVLRYAKFCGRSNVTSPIPHRLHDPRCSMYGTGYIIYLQYKSVYYSIMIPNVHPMIPDVRIVYLPTKLGDFGQGQMLGFIFQHHASQMGMFFSLIVWEGIQCFSYRICSGLERFEQASVFFGWISSSLCTRSS